MLVTMLKLTEGMSGWIMPPPPVPYTKRDFTSLVDIRTAQIASVEPFIEIGSEAGLYPLIQDFLLDTLLTFKKRITKNKATYKIKQQYQLTKTFTSDLALYIVEFFVSPYDSDRGPSVFRR